jgi:RHH-type transcriptional regulator, proline utilization regulon repressor / proline dehydrogenase / delta 1-pyrroline-5-carboxylate dehydrogenase
MNEAIVDEAIELAASWLNQANRLLTDREKARQEQLARLLDNPQDKAFLTQLIDQSFRTADHRRVADQIHSLLSRYGVPQFFSPLDKLLTGLFLHGGRYVPDLAVPKIVEKMRQDSSHAIIDAAPQSLAAHLQERHREGVRVNVNHLGEEVLGEAEALKRLNAYLENLGCADIEYVSVKISTIFSQIVPLAFDHTVAVLMQRLSQLYRAAAQHLFTRSDGTQVPKFVNLDMESYRDLEITARAFMQTLDQQEFQNHFAGMALQAYLPDSYRLLQDITAWAQTRVKAGGSPVKIRIVKGANMEMELVDAAIYDWPPAPYGRKLDTDANYKRMLDFAMQPENIQAVRLGVASHNVFDLAYAYLLGRRNQVTDYFSFEMLEGMADHVRRTVQQTGQEVVLYAPVATKDQFISAIAYLIRRLDENTGKDNFLRHLNRLKAGSRAWDALEQQFRAAVNHKLHLGSRTHRTQNRLTETFADNLGTFHEGEFRNEPNTDWSLAPNRRWAEAIRTTWQKRPDDAPLEIPLVVAGKEIFAGRDIRDSLDPSQHNPPATVARFALANPEDVNRAVSTAKSDPDGWRRLNLRQRHQVLSGVALELRKARGDLIGAAAANTGKVFTEADVEVSEAVDFAEYYPFSAYAYSELKHVRSRGKGVGVVISPWNFPIAIPCGGIVASLAAGNTVIFKPSSEAVLVAWLLCRCFWRAGVSQRVLQFLPCSGTSAGSRLVAHPDVDYVILTGGTETGLKILQQRPDLFLAAETGGKNATIVTAMSDRDQAIANALVSAFSNCGQKCSATSLLILESEVYEDSHFRDQLVDAARSLPVGSAWDFVNRMGPLIHPPQGDLQHALTALESGESWALKPENIGDNPRLWTTGIKWDVQPASITHMTEFFGPLLAVMRAQDLDHAVELVNQTGYGLTSGLESLDSREHQRWKDKIRAGNLYINRSTTGAVTLRQPFGGMGKSALGAGIKAGGPNYVAQFMDYDDTGLPEVGPIRRPHSLLNLAQRWQSKLNWGGFAEHREDLRRTVRAIKSYLYRFETEFSRETDYFHLRGQDNILRYLPVGEVVVRLHPSDTLFETLARIAAVQISGCTLKISLPPKLRNSVVGFLEETEGWGLIGEAPCVRESDAELAAGIPRTDRIRYAAPDRVPREVYHSAASHGFYIARTPVTMEGRIELLQYCRQQSICYNYHRYGNLGDRAID